MNARGKIFRWVSPHWSGVYPPEFLSIENFDKK